MTKPRNLILHEFSEWSKRPAPKWLVPDFIPERSLGSVTAPSGGMKSWLLMTLAFRAADGATWRGNSIDRFSTVYVAAENPDSHARRQAMYMRRCGSPGHGAFLIADQIDLYSADCRLQLKAAIERAETRSDLHCRLLIVDTLRDAWTGNEDSSTESARALSTLKSIRDDLGVSVLFAHHSGHNGDRERGSSNWRANVDFAWQINKSGEVATAQCVKMRDGPDDLSFSYTLDEDENGDVIVSFIDAPPASNRRYPLTGQKKLALDALNDATVENGEALPTTLGLPPSLRGVLLRTWRAAFYSKHAGSDSAKEKAFQRAAHDLQNLNLIGKDGDWVWPVSIT